jgi:hypothetical protein
MCTVQAPQSAMPQPNLVPVIPSVSLKYHSSGIPGATSAFCGFPFRLNWMDGIKLLSFKCPAFKR